MSIPIPRSLGSRFTTLLHSYVQSDGLPLASVLTEPQIQAAARAERVTFGTRDNDVYTPAITLWAFVGQVLAGRKSCVAAVARIIALRVALGLPPCSSRTGAYCKARVKLSENFLRRLTYQVGSEVEDQAPAKWRWHDRRVLFADGTTGTLPDSAENQAAYPQPRSQRPGLGFPMIRLIVLVTFATATIVGAAFGPYKGKETGETALFRQLFEQLRAGDVVVADRYYCSYWMIALLLQRGVDVAFRLHQLRKYDFARGRRLGHDDHVVDWHRPARPSWMDEATYATMPETISVREVRFQVDEPGYRTRALIVATTLLDERVYRREDIADLYHRRWLAELDLRAIKRTLGMERLTCQTPAMARKELWAHLLGYNLVRKVAAQAAWDKGLNPRQLSFAGTVQIVAEFQMVLLACDNDDERVRVGQVMFAAIVVHRVGDRPGRVEPRCVKRRSGNAYPVLTEPRGEARAKLIDPVA